MTALEIALHSELNRLFSPHNIKPEERPKLAGRLWIEAALGVRLRSIRGDKNAYAIKGECNWLSAEIMARMLVLHRGDNVRLDVSKAELTYFGDSRKTLAKLIKTYAPIVVKLSTLLPPEPLVSHPSHPDCWRPRGINCVLYSLHATTEERAIYEFVPLLVFLSGVRLFELSHIRSQPKTEGCLNGVYDSAQWAASECSLRIVDGRTAEPASV